MFGQPGTIGVDGDAPVPKVHEESHDHDPDHVEPLCHVAEVVSKAATAFALVDVTLDVQLPNEVPTRSMTLLAPDVASAFTVATGRYAHVELASTSVVLVMRLPDSGQRQPEPPVERSVHPPPSVVMSQ